MEPPTCLADAGRSLWRSTHEARLVTGPLSDLLLLACKQADRAAEARAELRNAKVVSEDRFGQEKIHPAVQIERQASLACAAIMEKVLGKVSSETADADDDAELFG